MILFTFSVDMIFQVSFSNYHPALLQTTSRSSKIFKNVFNNTNEIVSKGVDVKKVYLFFIVRRL